jgi:hypothetical protein
MGTREYGSSVRTTRRNFIGIIVFLFEYSYKPPNRRLRKCHYLYFRALSLPKSVEIRDFSTNSLLFGSFPRSKDVYNLEILLQSRQSFVGRSRKCHSVFSTVLENSDLLVINIATGVPNHCYAEFQPARRNQPGYSFIQPALREGDFTLFATSECGSPIQKHFPEKFHISRSENWTTHNLLHTAIFEEPRECLRSSQKTCCRKETNASTERATDRQTSLVEIARDQLLTGSVLQC